MGLGGWSSGGGGTKLGGGTTQTGPGSAGFTYTPASNMIWGGGGGSASTPTAPPPPMRGATPPPQAQMSQQTTPSTSGSTPYGAAGETAETLQDYGTGLLDPNSPESQRWMEELREQIGRSTDASQRAAGYMGAQAGFGAGSSPEGV